VLRIESQIRSLRQMLNLFGQTVRIVVLLLVAMVVLPEATNAQTSRLSGILWSVDWSFNDRYFAVGGERTLWVFDSKTRKQVPWSAPDVLHVGMAVKWHPQKNLLAVAGDKEVTGIYDLSTGHKTPLKTAEGARGVSWNHSGDLLATAGNDGSMQVWQTDGTLLHTTRPENGKSLTGIEWHPSKNSFVSVGEFIAIHDGEGKILKQITHRPAAEGFCLLLCVEGHPSGEFFVVGDYGNHETGDPPVLQFWSPEGTLLKTIVQEGGAEFRNIGWSPDGSWLASASDALRVWTKDGTLLNSGDPASLLWGVRWNHADDQLLTSSLRGDVTLWNSKADGPEEIRLNRGRK